MIDYKRLIEDVWEAGGKAYLVGGWVRDRLLGRPSEDIDIEVIGIERGKLEEILKGYGRYYRCGKAYEIYILAHKVEISFIEGDIELGEAAMRRDFTINALYYDPRDEKVFDCCGGKKDLEEGILRYIDRKNFLEDPIRIVRGAELSSRLGFEISDDLLALMYENRELLRDAASERFVEEFRKIYLLSEKPSRAFEIMNGTGTLEMILPEIIGLKDIIQDEIYHPEGDVYTHILMMMDILPLEERSMDIFWSIIYHDVGKAETWPDFRGHAKRSKEIFLEEGQRLIKDKKLIKRVAGLIEYHEEPLKFLIEGFDRIKVKRLAVKVDIEGLLKLYRCDVLGRGRKENNQELETIEAIKTIYEEVKEELKPIVRGRDLIEWGAGDRERFSEILEILYEAQLDEKIKDIEEAKVFYLRKIKV